MPGNRISSRTVLVVVLPTLVAIVAVAALYLLTIQRERRDRLTLSYLRELAVVAGQFEGLLSSKADSILNATKDPDGKPREEPRSETFTRLGLTNSAPGDDCRNVTVKGLTAAVCVSTERGAEQTKSMTESSVTEMGWPDQKRLSTVFFCPDGMPPSAAKRREGCGQIDLNSLLEPLIAFSSFHDEEFFFGIGNDVMYQRGERSFRVTDVKSLTPPPPPPPNQNPPATQTEVDLTARSVAMDVTIGGRAFKLVSQPLLFSSAKDEHGGGAWILGALIAMDHFEKRVNAPSWTWGGYTTLLVVLLALAIPVLKVATIGRTDHLEARDVRLLAASLVLLAGGATATSYWLWAYTRFDAALDGELESVARQVRENLLREVRHVAAAMDAYSNDWIQLQLHPDGWPVCTAAVQSDVPRRYELPRLIGNLFGESSLPGGKRCGPFANCPSRAWQESLKALYPYIAVLSWSDEKEAVQKEKWSITNSPAPPIKVGARPWFVDAVGGRVWGLPAKDGSPRQEVAVHMVNSVTLGAITPTVSKHYRDDEGNSYVVNMVPHLVSVSHPVLPTGFSFAIIQTDGRVVFHSKPSRRLYENFYAEVTLEHGVRAAIEAAHERAFTGDYHGDRQRMFVTPLPHSPWTLVAMRDKGAQQRQSLDVLVTWIIEFLAYVLFLAAMYGLWRWLGAAGLRDWLWPRPGNARVYRRAVFVLVAGVAASLLAILAPWHMPPLGTLLLVVAIAMSCCAFALAGIGASRAPARASTPESPETTVTARERREAVPPIFRVLWPLVFIVVLCEVAIGNLFVCSVATILAVITIGHVWGAVRSRDTVNWRFDVTALWLMLLLLTAALPAALLLQDSWDVGMEIFVRNGQLRLGEDVRKLASDNASEYTKAGAGISDELLAWRQAGWIGRPAGEPRAERSAEIVTSGIFGELQPCLESPGSTEVCVEPIGGEEFGIVNAILAWARTRPAAAIMSRLPIREEEAIHTRGLIDATATDQRWSWQRVNDTGTDNAELCWYRPCLEPSQDWEHGPFASDAKHARSRIRSTTPFPALQTLAAIPPFTTLQEPTSWWRAIIVVLALLVAHLALTVLRFLGKQVIGLDQWRGRAATPATTPQYASGLLLVQPELAAIPGDGICDVDFARPDAEKPPAPEPPAAKTAAAGTAAPEPPAPEPKDAAPDTRVIVVRNLDAALADAARAGSALPFLEAKVLREGRTVVVHSAVGPLTFLFDEASRAAPDAVPPATIARWARVLERLALLPARAARELPGAQLVDWARTIADCNRTGTPPEPRPFAAWPRDAVVKLWAECRATARLRGIAREMLAHGSSDEGIASRLEYTAFAHYYTLWSQLSREEQTLLVQLAQGEYVNPRSWRTARSLVQKGVLRFDGAPRVMNRSFRRFVIERAAIHSVRDPQAPSQWERIRDPLYYMLIAGGLLIYFTQPEGWTRLVGVLSAVGSVMTKFSEASGILGRLKPGAPAGK